MPIMGEASVYHSAPVNDDDKTHNPAFESECVRYVGDGGPLGRITSNDILTGTETANVGT